MTGWKARCHEGDASRASFAEVSGGGRSWPFRNFGAHRPDARRDRAGEVRITHPHHETPRRRAPSLRSGRKSAVGCPAREGNLATVLEPVPRRAVLQATDAIRGHRPTRPRSIRDRHCRHRGRVRCRRHAQTPPRLRGPTVRRRGVQRTAVGASLWRAAVIPSRMPGGGRTPCRDAAP